MHRCKHTHIPHECGLEVGTMLVPDRVHHAIGFTLLGVDVLGADLGQPDASARVNLQQTVLEALGHVLHAVLELRDQASKKRPAIARQ